MRVISGRLWSTCLNSCYTPILWTVRTLHHFYIEEHEWYGSKDTDTGPLNEAAKLRFEGLFRMKCFEDLSQATYYI